MKSPTPKAIIRQCNQCGIITAMSTTVSEKRKKEFALSHQTVTVIGLDEARKLWNDFGGYCKCEE